MSSRASIPAALAISLLAAASSPAQNPADAPYFTRVDTPPVIRAYASERWGIVGATVANPTDRAQELLSAFRFTENSDSQPQFARQFWLPPQARLSAWCPLVPPAGPRRAAIATRAFLIRPSGDKEVLLGDPNGTVFYNGLLPSSQDPSPIVGLLGDQDNEADSLVRMVRAAAKMSTRLLHVDGDGCPPMPQCLQALDALVVGSDRTALSADAVTAVRQWLHGGGRLWIMLDRVSLATASRLLGEDLDWSVADRVGLSQWRLERQRRIADLDDDAVEFSEPPPPGEEPGTGRVAPFEPPVDMVRLVGTGIRPVYTVGRWPAIFWRRAGRGLVLFTAVGPRGWVNRRPKLDAPVDYVDYVGQQPAPLQSIPHWGVQPPISINQPLRQVSAFFLQAYEKPTLAPEAFEPYLAGQIGYQIVSRTAVVSVLASFCLVLAVAGLGLSRLGSLSHLGWIGPGAAAVAALLLVAEGRKSRHAVPSTVAEAQFIEVAPGAEGACAGGLLHFYCQEEWPAGLGGTRGNIFFPEIHADAGATQRLVWTDLERWHWQNLPLSPGLHQAAFASCARLDRPVSARATFGPEGVTGKLAGEWLHDPADAILALPSRRNLAVRFLDRDGNFASGPSDGLKKEQYLDSSVVSEEQARRQALYQRLLVGDRDNPSHFPRKPTFLTWAAPLDLGFTFPKGARRTGAALVAIPLALQRPATGTTVLIPDAFLPYRPVPWKGVREATALYDPRIDRWLAARKERGRTMLRFQVPAELLPLHLDRAALTIELNAQARLFEVFAGDGARVLESRKSPLGTVHFEFTQPEALQLDAKGCLQLGIAIGEADRFLGESRGTSEWKIEELRLELVGQTLAP